MGSAIDRCETQSRSDAMGFSSRIEDEREILPPAHSNTQYPEIPFERSRRAADASRAVVERWLPKG